MTKKEFFTKLRKKINILKKSEQDDIIKEYEGYIEEKIASGNTEEEAIKDFGNIDDLAKELLDAYKINEEYEDKNSIEKVANKTVDYIDKVAARFNEATFIDIIKFLFELFILFAIVAIVHIPISIIISEGISLFRKLPMQISNILEFILTFILEASYFVLAIIIIVKVFEKRYLSKEEYVVDEAKTLIRDNKKVFKKVIKKEPKREDHFLDVLANIGIIFIKFILLCFLIPTIIILIGLIVSLVLWFIVTIKGAGIIGIGLIILSCILVGSTAFEIIFRLIFNKSQAAIRYLIMFLISIALMGIGSGITAYEFASSSYSDTLPPNYIYTVKTSEYEMNDFGFLDVFGRIEYEADNSLGSKIIIKTSYVEDLVSINEKIYNGTLQISTNNVKKYFGEDIIDMFIDNLGKKEFYNYELLFRPIVTVVASNENLEFIKKFSYSYSDYITLNNYVYTHYYGSVNDITDLVDSTEKISEKAAMDVAIKKISAIAKDITSISISLNSDIDDNIVYDIEFYYHNFEYKFEISADSGEIVYYKLDR